MNEPLTAPPERTASQRLSILLAVYAQLTSSALGYHSIVINFNVMCLSVNTLLVGYLISNRAAAHQVPPYLLATIPAILGGTGMIVTPIIRSHYQAIAAVIRRIDVLFGSFADDYFGSGPALYPEAWRSYGSRRWHEVVFDLFLPLQFLMGAVGAALVALR